MKERIWWVLGRIRPWSAGYVDHRRTLEGTLPDGRTCRLDAEGGVLRIGRYRAAYCVGSAEFIGHFGEGAPEVLRLAEDADWARAQELLKEADVEAGAAARWLHKEPGA